MDKVITSHTQKLGDQGEVAVKLGIEGQDLILEASANYRKPVAEVVNPVLAKLDELVDWVEKKIPGDQMEEANRLKAEIKNTLINGLIGSIPSESKPQVEAPKEA